MKAFLATLLLLNSLSALAITIGAYNIRNFDYDQRSRVPTDKMELSKILRSLRTDVLSIEEINNTREWQRFVQVKMPGYGTQVSECGGQHGQRLGFLYNKRTIDFLGFDEDLSISNPGTPGSCDSGSRPLAIGLFQIKATGQKFFGLTAHLKSGSHASSMEKRARQYEILKRVINKLKKEHGVEDFYFAGDLNTTEFRNRGADYRLLNQVVKDLRMTNVTSNLKCTAYYWGGSDDGIETPSMLDHIVVTPGLLKKTPRVQVHGHCQKASCREVPIASLGISYESVSDHCPITATIQ